MMKALEEYKEMVWNPYREWAKKHWKGHLVFVLIISVIRGFGPYLWSHRSDITEYIKSRFKKNEEES